MNYSDMLKAVLREDVVMGKTPEPEDVGALAWMESTDGDTYGCWQCQQVSEVMLQSPGHPLLFSCLTGTPGYEGHLARLLRETKDWTERHLIPLTEEAATRLRPKA